MQEPLNPKTLPIAIKKQQTTSIFIFIWFDAGGFKDSLEICLIETLKNHFSVEPLKISGEAKQAEQFGCSAVPFAAPVRELQLEWGGMQGEQLLQAGAGGGSESLPELPGAVLSCFTSLGASALYQGFVFSFFNE